MPALAATGEYASGRVALPQRRAYGLDIVDYTLFLPGIWLACGLGISLRLIGPLFIVIPIGTCLLYAIARRVVPPRLLTAYVAFCVLTGILSEYRLYPVSWEVHFMADAIARQQVPLFGFFAVAWASKAYFRRRLADADAFHFAPVFIALSFALATAVMIQQNVGYQGDHSAFAVMALAGAFVNNIEIGLSFVLAALFTASGWRRYAALGMVLGIAAITHFIQFRVFALAIVAILFRIPARRLVIALVVALPLVYAGAMHFTPTLMIKHPNEALRLVFVQDALSSVVDTHGIGIGYGTESVRWVYRFPGLPPFTFLPDPQSMTHQRMLEALSNGVENSLVEALLRTGIPGFLLLTLAIFAAFPPAGLPRSVENHAACLFAMMFLALFVNASLESPLAVVGQGFVYGYLLALRASARFPAAARLGNVAPPGFAPTRGYALQ